MTSDAGVPGAPRFDVVLRGYDRRQVDDHVDRLQRVLSRMRADLDVARSQPLPVARPAPQAAPRPRPSPRPRQDAPLPPGGSPDTIGDFTDRMQSILQAAEEEAAEIRRNARRAARAETDGIRSQLADLTRQRDAVLAELTRLRGQLEGLLAAPTAAMPPREGARQQGSPQQGSPRQGGTPQQPGGAGQATPSQGRPPQNRPSPQEAPRPAAATPHSTPHSTPNGSASPSPAPSGPAKPAQPKPAVGPSSERPAQASEAGPKRPGAAGAPRPTPTPPTSTPGVAGSSAGAEQVGRSAPESGSTVPEESAAAARSERETGKAAHRLPSGAYPMVGEQPRSLRPRSEPQPEPGELFRSATDRHDEPQPRTTAVPQQPAGDRPGANEPNTRAPGAERPAEDGSGADGASGGDRTAMVPGVSPRAADQPNTGRKTEPGDVESTVAVGAVRPNDPTVMAPAPTASRPEGADRPADEDTEASAKPGGTSSSGPRKPPSERPANGQGGSSRPSSSSRSG